VLNNARLGCDVLIHCHFTVVSYTEETPAARRPARSCTFAVSYQSDSEYYPTSGYDDARMA
jgi:hypothetical protein